MIMLFQTDLSFGREYTAAIEAKQVGESATTDSNNNNHYTRLATSRPHEFWSEWSKAFRPQSRWASDRSSRAILNLTKDFFESNNYDRETLD